MMLSYTVHVADGSPAAPASPPLGASCPACSTSVGSCGGPDRRMRTVSLASVFLMAAAALCAAQPTRPAVAAPAGQDSPLPSSSAAPLDLNTIDPLTFKAMAARLPKGLAPKIDGRMTDAAWALASPAGNFYPAGTRPGAVDRAHGVPRALRRPEDLLRDLGLRLGSRGIIASEMKRDSGLNKGDRIAIVIDTFNDRRNGFYFATNPLGAEKDAQYTDNARVRNNDWNAVWECRTSVDDHGLVRGDRHSAQPAAVQERRPAKRPGASTSRAPSSARTKSPTGCRTRGCRPPTASPTCRTRACSWACGPAPAATAGVRAVHGAAGGQGLRHGTTTTSPTTSGSTRASALATR